MVIWLPGLGDLQPDHQPEVSAAVCVRRRRAVMLSIRVPPGAGLEPAQVEVCADASPIARMFTTHAGAHAALAALLRGPAWLQVVAVEVSCHVLGMLWALIPASAAEARPEEIGDEELVYALPLAEIELSADRRTHPYDLAAELHTLIADLLPRRGTAA